MLEEADEATAIVLHRVADDIVPTDQGVWVFVFPHARHMVEVYVAKRQDLDGLDQFVGHRAL
ncbi:hypothetical protein BW45_06245 [Agrobacterium tumefaciens]|nr:hypothetical protein BW45_06245 [Agrobacterium tumefaciens]